MEKDTSMNDDRIKDLEVVIRKWVDDGAELWEVVYALSFMATSLGLEWTKNELGILTMVLQGVNEAIAREADVQDIEKKQEREKQEKETQEYVDTSEPPTNCSIH